MRSIQGEGKSTKVGRQRNGAIFCNPHVHPWADQDLEWGFKSVNRGIF
jgi:hypothetical protein